MSAQENAMENSQECEAFAAFRHWEKESTIPLSYFRQVLGDPMVSFSPNEGVGPRGAEANTPSVLTSLSGWLQSQAGVLGAYVEERGQGEYVVYVCMQSEALADLEAFYEQALVQLDKADPGVGTSIDIEVVPASRKADLEGQAYVGSLLP